MPQVITRFPPSPTGLLQMGNVRTAIYNYLYAKQHEGSFLFRIEDTDRERSTKEYEVSLIENLKWLGLNWDNTEVIHQSERGEVYSRYLEKMVRDGFAYVSKEDTGGDATKRAEVIRFKNPKKKVTFMDLIRGEITFDTTDLGDFVVARSMTEPIYHLSVVIDDFESKITHIIRGEDHISNTPRQILIQEAIGAPRPIYAHLPLILDSDRAKLSKRKHGEKVSLKYFRDQGYLKEAIINYMSMLGWNPGTPQELFTLDELLKSFDISKVQKAGAVFDEEKLKWFNRAHLAKLSQEEFASGAASFWPKHMDMNGELAKRLLAAVREKVSVFSEIPALFATGGELAFAKELSDYPTSMLLWKKKPDQTVSKTNLEACLKLLSAVPTASFTSETVKAAVWPLTESNGRGEVLWPLRVALTGQEKSPDPFVSAFILGKDESLNRLEQAIRKCA